jgi:hypothetical protein
MFPPDRFTGTILCMITPVGPPAMTLTGLTVTNSDTGCSCGVYFTEAPRGFAFIATQRS